MDLEKTILRRREITQAVFPQSRKLNAAVSIWPNTTAEVVELHVCRDRMGRKGKISQFNLSLLDVGKWLLSEWEASAGAVARLE